MGCTVLIVLLQLIVKFALGIAQLSEPKERAVCLGALWARRPPPCVSYRVPLEYGESVTMSKFYGGSLDFIQLLWAMAVTLVIWVYEELRVHSRRAWC